MRVEDLRMEEAQWAEEEGEIKTGNRCEMKDNKMGQIRN